MDIAEYIEAYREPYEKALAELAKLTDRLEQIDIERDDIFTRMAEVREGIAALAPLVKENPTETHPELFPDESGIGADLGLTDAIRKVLSNANPRELTPVGVRTGLAAIGFKTESKNLLSSIHSVLKRLKKSAEVLTRTGEDGRTWYRWNAPTYNPPDKPEWYKRLKKAGQTLDYSALTPTQRREARALGLVDEPKAQRPKLIERLREKMKEEGAEPNKPYKVNPLLQEGVDRKVTKLT